MYKSRDKRNQTDAGIGCPYAGRCGACDYQGVPYAEQLAEKEREVRKLLGSFGTVHPICGMEDPYHYRHKVHAAFDRTKDGRIQSGLYEEHTRRMVPVEYCLIEHRAADALITDLRELIRSFKFSIYNERSGRGFLRHVLIRVSRASGEILLVLVGTETTFPSKKNFIKALRAKHPEVTSVVLNVNTKDTGMVLGTRDIVLYGPGYVEDTICGLRFRISPQSFYQINPPQAERLYRKAIELAALHGRGRVIDAYCGTGTISLSAAGDAKEVIGIELNRDAVKDAVANAKANGIRNARFLVGDAGEELMKMASAGERADVLFMDPPRSGSTERFLRAVAELAPPRVVYISCNPETLKRDLQILQRLGYGCEGIYPYDFFGFTKHTEIVCALSGFLT